VNFAGLSLNLQSYIYVKVNVLSPAAPGRQRTCAKFQLLPAMESRLTIRALGDRCIHT
jgi:hypothetical protein